METNRDLSRYRRLLRQAAISLTTIFDESDLTALIRIIRNATIEDPDHLPTWLDETLHYSEVMYDAETLYHVASLMRDVRALTTLQLAALLDLAERHAATGALDPDLDALLA